MIIQIVFIASLLLCIRFRKLEDDGFWNAKEISVAKGFLILLIVIYHSSFDMVIHKGIMQLVDNYVSAIAVALFSFLSAYAVEIKYSNARVFFYKWLFGKFIYILVIYVIVAGIKWIIGIPVDSAGMMWINAFLLSYLVEGVAHKLLDANAWKMIVIFWFAYSIIVHVLPNPLFWWPHQSLGFAYGSLFYLFNAKLLRKTQYKFVTLFLSGLIAFIMIYLYMINGEYPNVTVFMQIERNIATLMLLISVVQIMFFITLKSRIIGSVGKISLYIFLIHGIWVEILKSFYSGTLYVLMVVGCTLISAFITYYIHLLIKSVFHKIITVFQ